MGINVLQNLVRIGKVSSTDPAALTVRVVFDDKDGMVSGDLPVIVPNSMKNKDYAVPDVGEQVVCIFLANGISQGFCLGSFYSSEDTPPVSDRNKRHIRFEDGTTIEYDRSSSTLTIDCKGPINIKATGNVTVTGDVIADGISLKNHVHGGVEPGPGSTGAPS